MTWFPGLHKVFEWRINRLWRKGAAPERQAAVAAAYVRLRPSDPHAWALYGHVLTVQERYVEAERVLRRGLDLHPTADPDLGWVLARALRGQSKREEARELLLDQTQAFPDSRLPFLGLAELALISRRFDEAIDHANEALARTSSIDAAAKCETALILAPIPAVRERTVALLREAVTGMPHHALSHLLLGELLEIEGNSEAANHIERARMLWEAPTDFDEMLRQGRESLRKLESGG